MSEVVIGSRGSKLALWQAEFIQAELRKLGIFSSIKIIKTTGDKILDAPLAKIGGKGLFTKELEENLLNGAITLAVHSLKDVPVEIPRGLILSTITKREDVRDCFISNAFENIESLPQNARVGTTSLRRAMQIKFLRGDIRTLNLRGNVQTRLQKLQNGEFDAIILAKAALNRLEIESDVRFVAPLAPEIMIPAMGQGALGIECHEDCAILAQLQRLNDEVASVECGFEREFIRLLGGGCQVPIGVYAKCAGNQVAMSAAIGLPNGAKIIRDSVLGDKSENLAQILLSKMESKGAREILKDALRMLESGDLLE